MCLPAIAALLFLGAAVWNLLHGDTENAKFGFVIGGVLAAFAYGMACEENTSQEFLALLVESEEKLKSGAEINYRGTPISSATEVTQYYICVSFLILTTKIPSRFYIRGAHKGISIGFIYSAITLVFGWWGLPWGPIYTIQSLYKNLRGGDKKSVAQLMGEIEKVAQSDVEAKAVGAQSKQPLVPNSTQNPGKPPESPWS